MKAVMLSIRPKWVEKIASGEKNLLYAEYPATDPRCIRETDTERVTALFRDKLVRKWKQDIENGRPPKWTNREKPNFWEE